jgi:hypothetical protein
VATVGVRGALLLDIATFLVSATLARAFLQDRAAAVEPTARGSLLDDAAEGVTGVRRSPTLRWLLAWGLLGAGATIAPEGLAVAVAADRGDGATEAGILTAAVPFGFLVGSVLLLRLVPAERRLAALPLLAVGCCLPLLLTPLVSTSWGIAALWAVAGAGSVLQLVASTAYIAAAPRELRARAYGVAVTALMSLQGAVLLLAGAAAEVVDPRVVVAGAAAGALLLLPLAQALSPGRASRDRPAARSRAAFEAGP